MGTPVITRQQQLAILLASLEGFSSPDPSYEQVVTPSHEAGALLWEALLRGDIRDRTVVDLGCGPGRLAIGSALLGAKRAIGVDRDRRVLAIARKNASAHSVRVRWVAAEVDHLPRLQVETVLMNPPFGVQRRDAEVPFFEAALCLLPAGGAVYGFAGPGSQTLIEETALRQGVRVEDRVRSTWPFPPTFRHHRQRMGKVLVDRWILRKEAT